MKIAPLADVKARLSAYIDHAEESGPVVITRNGKAVAMLIAPEDEDDLERLVLANSPRFMAMLDRSRKSIEEGKGIPAKEFWKQVKERNKSKAAKGGKTGKTSARRS